MSMPKTKAKPQNSLRTSLDAEQAGSVRPIEQEEFSALVDSIARRFGVEVTSTSAPTHNPYAMSPEQAAKVALRAGIITRKGNLKYPFK